MTEFTETRRLTTKSWYLKLVWPHNGEFWQNNTTCSKPAETHRVHPNYVVNSKIVIFKASLASQW